MPQSKTSKCKARKNSGDPQKHGMENNNCSSVRCNDEHDEKAQQLTCCTPRGCKMPEVNPSPDDSSSKVKVLCNNPDCSQSGWMHKECFEDWEDHVLAYLKSCGRARSWSDKQRSQNLWTKKGYDLAYKACDCLCGKGHIRKDLEYTPSKTSEDVRKQKTLHRTNEKPLPVSSVRSQPIPVGGVRPRVQIRQRATSFSSTGSSPPTSASPSSSPTTLRPVDRNQDMKFEFVLTQEQAAAGNIFHHRPDLRAFNKLPAHKRNPYHIKMEDEGPYGNDETRCFVLSSLSTKRVTSIPCVVCGQDLKIFDRYPLIDGTLFLTPQRYISEIGVESHGHSVYMNAVCMMCSEGLYTELRCKQCHQPWNGSALQVGTMYSYDVFAAAPCCLRRLQCKNCGKLAVGAGQNMPFFSQFSFYCTSMRVLHERRVSNDYAVQPAIYSFSPIKLANQIRVEHTPAVTAKLLDIISSSH